MSSLKTKVRADIYSQRYDAWKIAEPSDPAGDVKTVSVRLEIRGNDKDGYHLVMTPDGCFTADNWYATEAEAVSDATELFGTDEADWKPRIP